MRTLFKFSRFFLILVLFHSYPGLIKAKEILTQRVILKHGPTGAVIDNRIKENEVYDYVLSAEADQRIMVILDTDNPGNYFDVIPPETDEAMHIGSVSGNRFEVRAPTSGEYTIRVFLLRNAAHSNESANYTLSVNTSSVDSALQVAANGSLAGLEEKLEYWEVIGVASSDALNLRSGPSVQNSVISKFVNGQVLINLGCTKTGGQKWCEVRRADGQGPSGWVAAHYLRKTSEPLVEEGAKVNLPRGNGQPFNAAGEIPCSLAADEPIENCPFGVIQEDDGNAGVWIEMNGHGERHIRFKAGEPIESDSKSNLSFEHSGALYLIRIGDEERYEIPETVIKGG